ncbi:MAG TPA: outer membrane protein assembly factor BamD [Alphaproteobacteria bacterium]|jgi:outer membrane protein assembly factor BamD
MPLSRRLSSALAAPLFALSMSLALSACGSDEDAKVMPDRPAEDMFNEAMSDMQEGAPADAVKLFDEVDRQHPYSVWATKSQLLNAYANYEMNKYDEAISGLDRFIALHPGSKDIAYAYYLKALSYYERIPDITRDQSLTNGALNALQEVVRRFPDSKYARDAKLKIDLAYDNLAGKEMEVGRYYQKRSEPQAAIARYRRVIELYQTTSHVPEALHRLTECYMQIGLPQEAQTAAAVLGHNFPGSEWYQDSYQLMTGAQLAPAEDKSSWISRAWASVF